jgi:hypothetical protein
MAEVTDRDFAGVTKRPRRTYISRTMARHPIAWRATIAAALTFVVLAAAYLSFSKWAVAHDSLDFIDKARGRTIDVDLAVRFDVRMKARAGMGKMPVAVLSHGNTVKYTEYSFIANLLAARGYMVVSIQHDMPKDAELVTQQGSLFVGRLKVYERGEANILYTLDQMKKIEPEAEYGDLTLVGHSNGGDISMYFAQQHPDMVRKVITLDNLRVPFITSGPKILSIRSRDWKPDPGVLPDDEAAKKAGIEIIRSDAQHTDMSDRGPDTVKQTIQNSLEKFLGEADSSGLAPVKNKDVMSDVRAMGP